MDYSPWWVATVERLKDTAHRAEWAHRFATEPELFCAREWADKGLYLGLRTFSGYYNDHVPQGFMTTDQAWDLYQSAKHT